MQINGKIKKIDNVGSTRLNIEFENLLFAKKYKSIHFHILLTFEHVKADPNYKEEEVVAKSTCPSNCYVTVFGACTTECTLVSCS